MDPKTIPHLLDRYPTPLYVFEERVLKERVRYLRERLPKEVGLCFAVKANPFLGQFLTDSVERFEICSPGEMYICEAQGISAGQFVLSGVYKDEASMRHAFSHGLCEGLLTVESVRQFDLIRSLAEEYRRPVRLLLRLTSGSQFGLEEDELLSLISRCGTDSSSLPSGSALLTFAGIQFFSGTQKTSLKKHRRELNLLDDVIDRVRAESGLEVPEIEYGPGFPVVYFDTETFDEDAYLKEFSMLLESMRNRVPVMLELGRSIAASCGSLLTKVVDLKRNHDQSYAILDSGIHHLAYYGQFMAMKHPFCEVWPPRGRDAEDPEWNLCGSLCTVNDLVVKKLPVHDLKVGDAFLFHNTGAYSMTEGISLFLSRDLPGVLCLRESGDEMLLRGAEPTWKLNGGPDCKM